ncbi:uncharacterized protein LOC121997801 [Zingiber officinale]|uniref:uncharacterized protein LOC121997801 n=1 Tax=Zingiber officinale TaxID=94328 RepID=UPI001C4BF5B3|nr:uncharacterized protein LOC121997801 [Zingiber officinale]
MTYSSTQLQLLSDRPIASIFEKMDCRVCDIPDLVSATLLDSSSFLHRDVVIDPDNIFVDDITVPDSLDVAGVVFYDRSVGKTQESLSLIIRLAEPVEPFIVPSEDGSVVETQESLPLIVPDSEPNLLPDQDDATFTVLEPSGTFQDGKVDIFSESLGNTMEVVHFDCSGCDTSFDSCFVTFDIVSDTSYSVCVQDLHPLFSAQDFFRHFICSQSCKDAVYHLKKALTLYAIMKLLEWTLQLNHLRPPEKIFKEFMVEGAILTSPTFIPLLEWFLDLNRLRSPEFQGSLFHLTFSFSFPFCLYILPCFICFCLVVHF